VKLCADFLPRDRFDAPCTVIGHAAFNFSRPRFFDPVVVTPVFEAFEQQPGELGALIGR
jgi:hypothetical protein